MKAKRSGNALRDRKTGKDLIRTASLIDSVDYMTERMLVDAGVGPGMCVLDVGCGSGDVSHLLAKLVGKEGQVIGIDRDGPSLEIARERVRKLNLSNITFTQADISSLSPDLGPFDAAVGRRVIMYLAEPVDAMRRISATLRPGGVVAFLEHDSTMVPGRLIPLPLQERVNGWIRKTVEREGANTHIGFDLPFILENAGLIVEHIRAESIIQTPKTNYPTGAIIRAMLPRIIQKGVATKEEIDLETLEQRLIDERIKANSIYVSDLVFTIWARKPGTSD
ncbi:methyltransferase domain-containing protein [Methanoregula sp.]|jgi:ubiquinone/menaquinone biosynthesis C-methylase UbiE|uniref:methyltransferase domain-containing protein n=1 Tax=Methanoregula sp. TaxID=2052170 RepID=UPI003C1E5845